MTQQTSPTAFPANDPFKMNEQVAKLKIAIWGGAKTGKTRFTLTAPDCAMIDADNKAIWHDNRPGNHGRMVIQDYDGIMEMVAWLGSEAHDYQTLVIDSMSAVETNLIEQRRKGLTLNMIDRAMVNHQLNALYAAVAILDMHVILTAHEATQYKDQKRIGIKPQAGGDLAYYCDLVLHLPQPDQMKVIQSSIPTIAANKLISPVEWATIAQMAGVIHWYDNRNAVVELIERTAPHLKMSDASHEAVEATLFKKLGITSWAAYLTRGDAARAIQQTVIDGDTPTDDQ